MSRPVGIPRGGRIVHAVPDGEPSCLDEFPPAVLADWIVADLRRRPAARPEPAAEPDLDDPAGQLAFDT